MNNLLRFMSRLTVNYMALDDTQHNFRIKLLCFKNVFNFAQSTAFGCRIFMLSTFDPVYVQLLRII